MNLFAHILVAVLRADVAMYEKKSLASYGMHLAVRIALGLFLHRADQWLRYGALPLGYNFVVQCNIFCGGFCDQFFVHW
jgi:hypothetical protein